MKLDLKNYLGERDQLEMSKTEGPLLTVSRQYGCESNKIVMKLLHRINAHMKSVKGTASRWQWRYISKEIIDESANELGLASKKLEQQILSKGRGTGSEIFFGLSKHYAVNDKKLFGTIKGIISDYAQVGNVIILGRGGAAMTQGNTNALHVRLIAPLDYRIKTISEKKNISKDDAKSMIKEIDAYRQSWTENLSGNEFTNDWFNILLNRKTLSDSEIVYTIFTLMQDRGMLN